MKLINVSNNFSVESFKFGNMTFEFVHNNKTMENYFNQKVLAKLFDIKQSTLSIHLNKYLKLIEEDNSFIDNINKACILFKTDETSQKVKFYDFNAVTYLAFKINTSNAVNVRNFISQTLNTMFNVATGRDSINSNKDWLKNQCEVKAVQAGKYKGASNLLYDGGLEHDAKKMWSKYKKFNAEALKYKELYLDYDRIDKIVANERDNSTKQLKLI